MFEDYWINVNYVERTHQPDGTGGFEDIYRIGEQFKMNVAIAGSDEQIVASQRGTVGEQYNVATYDNVSLRANDVVMFRNPDNERVFLRINSNMKHTPDRSNQSGWKYGTATQFEPDIRVVE